MRVLVRGAQFNGNARFETWLFTIARNLVIDQRRKRTMSSLDELIDGAGDDDRPMTFEVADDEPTPFRPLFKPRRPGTACGADCWNWMRYREVLVLRFYEELSLEEIAKVTTSAAIYCEIKALSWTGRNQTQAGGSACGAANRASAPPPRLSAPPL
jgi:RNA polymerase sigma-70 factor (ECF subfamily)